MMNSVFCLVILLDSRCYSLLIGTIHWNLIVIRYLYLLLFLMAAIDADYKTMAKWAARFALGLSSSFPGPMVAPENIEHEDDIGMYLFIIVLILS